MPESFGWDKPGLCLQGAAGTGKSLTAYAVLRREILAWGHTAEAYRVTLWAQQVVAKSKTGELGDWLAEQSECDYLLLDDLDKCKYTPRVVEALYEVMESRTSYGLPIVVTLNSTGEKFSEAMPEGYAEAILRRINDFCTVIQFPRRAR
jgi:DNA replication protein DnaC